MLVCGSCGQENLDVARFCLACGAPLAAPPRRESEERKVVSVLFVDLVGFTARSEFSDPEDVRARLRPYHERLRREIERFGGVVEKFVGDAVMAVFGAPVAREDDAERAVRAALRILEAIEELNGEQPGLELSVRAAVNSGQALVALGARPERGEGFVTGDVVNTASRLQGVAPVGGLVVGEGTFRATRDAIEFEELAPVVVKGKQEPIRLWRALQARSRFGADVVRENKTSLVGREDDVATLKQTYRRTLRESSIQLVTVTGEPGVGKSRLIAEFFAFVDAQPELVSWRLGRSLPYGEGITFWALSEIVKAQAGILESDRPEEADEKLAQAVEAVIAEPTEREWVRTRLHPLVGLGTGTAGAVERDELFTAWRTFLEGVAAQGPLVLVFEDLHWADPALLAFVEHLVEWASGVPLLVLCTARPELYDQAPHWGAGNRNAITIALSPLSRTETAQLLAALLARAVLPAETQALLLERAGGNPLYAEEFVRMLEERGLLAQGARGLILPPGAEVPLPEGVHALIAARLDTLAPERKALLHDAAVLGNVFWAGAVAAMGDRERRPVEAALHELARKELLRRARTSSVSGETEYSFWHALVLEVAYGQIPRAARARKHQAAARWIQGMAQARLDDHAELLAHHCREGLALARASHQPALAAELEPCALRFLVLAGERAAHLDNAKAYGYLQEALTLLPPDHPQRAPMLSKLSQAAVWVGRPDEAQTLAEEAMIRYKRQGDEIGAAHAKFLVAVPLTHSGQLARAGALLDEAIERLERHAPGPELAQAYVFQVQTEIARGNGPEAELRWAEKALQLALRLGLDETATSALQQRGYARCVVGDLGGLEDLQEALQQALTLNLGKATAAAYINLADWLWWIRGPREGLATLQAGIDFATRRGFESAATWAKAESLWMRFESGDWNELLDSADELITWDRQHESNTPHGLIALTYKTSVKLWQGHTAAAFAAFEELLRRARDVDDPQICAPALASAALMANARGQVETAQALLAELHATTRESAVWRAHVLTDAVRLSIALNAHELGERFLAELEVSAPRQRHAVLAAQGMLAEAAGDLSHALGLHLQAADSWREFGFRLEEGQALLACGRCLHRLGRAEEATGQLERARTVFAELAARPLLAEVNQRLAQNRALSA